MNACCNALSPTGVIYSLSATGDIHCRAPRLKRFGMTIKNRPKAVKNAYE